MTQEEKQLLLVDLCARLPYGVLCKVYDNEINEPVELLSINPKRNKSLEIDDGHDENSSTYWNLEDVKPYLRSMSSMTEEEKREYAEIVVKPQDCSYENNESATTMVNDWYLSKGFDVRGLIKKELALEALEGMYKK